MSTSQQIDQVSNITSAATSNNDAALENKKCITLKNFAICVTLAVLAIIGWHLYEHFTREPSIEDHAMPKEREILQFTKNLYDLELKRNPYLVKVNFQVKTKASYHDDRAPKPLLQVNNDLLVMNDLKTIFLMRRLFDNYELYTNAIEYVTAEEEEEELDFLKAVLETPVMKKTMQFLEFKGAVTNNYYSQLKLLKDIWFTQYARGQGGLGSSGFEHVFLAELVDQKVLGLHNWVYFNEQERLGHLNYKGYIDILDLEQTSQYVVALRSQFYNVSKPYNTLFVGTSPELELSLYTMCFVLSVGKPCMVQLGHSKFSITTHAWDWHGKKTLATAFPSLIK